MLSFMLEGEPHLKVVDEKRDSGKTRKLQVCSASVCVCVPVFLHAVARVGIVTGCVQYEYILCTTLEAPLCHQHCTEWVQKFINWLCIYGLGLGASMFTGAWKCSLQAKGLPRDRQVKDIFRRERSCVPAYLLLSWRLSSNAVPWTK